VESNTKKSRAALQKKMRSLCSTADDHRAQGRYAQAEPPYLRAMALAETVWGQDHAALKQAQGHLDEAERLYRRALDIKEKLLGSIHPDVAMTLNNMAVLSKTRGRYVEAEAMYRRAMAIFEQSLGTAHPKVIICRKNFASLMRKMEQNAPQPIRDL
jgi:tetratricopeptide (TPR) repeat protein